MSKNQIHNLRHVGLVVQDINKELEFYQRLGFKVVRSVQENKDFIFKVLNLDDPDVKTIKMSAVESSTLLELLEFSKKGNIARKKPNDVGYTHIALTVNSLNNLFESLKKGGIRFLSSPMISPDKKVKVAFCFDPENNLLELVEELGQ